MNKKEKLRDQLVNKSFTTNEHEHMEAAHFKYREVLMEIKNRTEVVVAIINNQNNLKFKLPTVEACYLQFRIILEHIVFGSIIANKELYSKQHSNFEKHWNAKYILKDMERINEGFYPRPILQKKSDPEQSEIEWIELSPDKYLTKIEFIELYEKCGAILHAKNPYGKKIDTEEYFSKIVFWLNKIMRLIECHTIILQGDDNHIYLFQMNGNNYPSYTSFFRMKIEDIVSE